MGGTVLSEPTNGSPDEEEQAQEWLMHLERSPYGFAALVDACGGHIEVAAYRLACAKLRASGRHYAAAIPTLSEVFVACKEIANRGILLDRIPHPRALESLLKAAGLQIMPTEAP